MIPRLVIAGTHSGVGKTTIATGLMAMAARRGLDVQGYKVGPDYIDPGYHGIATGRPSRNLDAWMLGERTVRELFARSARGADIAIIEGVMGLYDGSGETSETGSTAHVAKTINAPVILVVDARGLARSAAAMVAGYAGFDRDVRIAGVIFNNAGSREHYRFLAEAVTGATGIPALGWVPKDPAISLPERHLGLVPAVERGGAAAAIAGLASRLEQAIDFNAVLRVASLAGELPPVSGGIFDSIEPCRQVRIALARDRAFSFYYQDGLDLLEAFGAELVEFSPLADPGLPDGADAVYIGGGFPEVYAGELAANLPLFAGLRVAHERGMPIYAECGGLMYLCQAIIDGDGREHAMAGLVPGRARMGNRLAALGYVRAETLQDSVLGPRGEIYRGHVFHWSELQDVPPGAPRAYRLAGRRSQGQLDGYLAGNLLASYVHLHFAAVPQAARCYLATAARFRDRCFGRGSES